MGFATVIWFYLTPSAETLQTLHQTWIAFIILRTAALVFLFSGAFFPVANLDAPLEALARATPLWHGVDLTRMLVLGVPDWSMVAVHVAYLLVLVVLGWWWAVRRLTRRMQQ